MLLQVLKVVARRAGDSAWMRSAVSINEAVRNMICVGVSARFTPPGLSRLETQAC